MRILESVTFSSLLSCRSHLGRGVFIVVLTLFTVMPVAAIKLKKDFFITWRIIIIIIIITLSKINVTVDWPVIVDRELAVGMARVSMANGVTRARHRIYTRGMMCLGPLEPL